MARITLEVSCVPLTPSVLTLLASRFKGAVNNRVPCGSFFYTLVSHSIRTYIIITTVIFCLLVPACIELLQDLPQGFSNKLNITVVYVPLELVLRDELILYATHPTPYPLC